MMSLCKLPDDILITILMKIEPALLIDISKTSKQIHNLVNTIVFKKILIINNKPMSMYNYSDRDNFFCYIFDSYIFGNIVNVGIPFVDNNKTYVLIDINSNYIIHSNYIENSNFIFLHKGVETEIYDKNKQSKPKPIIIKNLHSTNTYSR
jgi:hypothetical protein